ncbi:hypothetical protein CBR_g36849 [Chara braunii]|uniref:Protein kinase domain-containing protein n=1 Tax=Chara braunii TaxID=69332 RepID=A0A388LLQ6_CHABU|nr:hypothetical protein CBR_g36849 [Chara braunii]|eukprot:GBG83234.1 hypothetical protein CBR_g36849 [Chara braunii]
MSAESKAAEMPAYGRNVEDYCIGRLLGRGSFGDVYEAKCRNTGKAVAIKMIRKEILQTKTMLEHVVREVEIHCQLRHPHVVELYEYFEDVSRVYLVTELCEKGELLTLLRQRGSLDIEAARTYFAQLVSGVQYLHSHCILHRDLKLSNLLLTADNNLKIADFGLAAAVHSADPERRTICGTPNYMSPEIVSQEPYSLAADVWALGITLFTFITGTPPFQV